MLGDPEIAAVLAEEIDRAFSLDEALFFRPVDAIFSARSRSPEPRGMDKRCHFALKPDVPTPRQGDPLGERQLGTTDRERAPGEVVSRSAR